MTSYRRMLSIALVLTMLIALVPACLGTTAAKADGDTLGKTLADKVNVRVAADPSAKLLFQIPKAGYVGKVLGEKTVGKIHWYKVEMQSPEENNSRYYTGWINGTYFGLLTEEEAAVYKEGSTIATPTPVPADSGSGVTPSPTPVPAQNVDIDADPNTIGVVNAGGVNMRKGPATSFGVITQLDRGDTVTVITKPSIISDKTFYRVRYNGQEGFIMSTFLNVDGVTPTNTGSAAQTTPPPVTGVVGYVTTIKGGVNLRQTAAGSTVIMQVKRNQTYPYLLQPVSKNNYKWYYVQVGEVRGFLRGDCVKEVAAPADATTIPPDPTATATETSATTTTPPPTGGVALSGYLKTTTGKVNLRKEAGYTDVLYQIPDKGTVMPTYGEPKTVNKVKWYYVYSDKIKKFCWIHGDYVTACNSEGGDAAAPATSGTNTATPPPAATDAPANQTEASYTTLRLGSSGNAVKNLTTELKNQGFYSGTPGTKYTTAVEKAVKDFQKAKGLTIDGIAGPATQHKLYGTVPIGAADVNNPSMTIYPAEKIDWFTGGINELWAKGSNYKVYDVKTGIVWWAHRWAGGLHVDAEPLTAQDTARLCKAYGVTTAKEIEDKNLYQRRPCLVTIGTWTFACSLYGIPHNDDGDTIPDNEYKGQLCIHFTNSQIHGSKKVDSGHQEAIQYDWEHAPNGHK